MDDRVYGDVMLDIETLGTGIHSLVVSIGAVRFRLDSTDDLYTIRDDARSFYSVLDTEDQRDRGRVDDPDTLAWWGKQSDEARQVLTDPTEDTANALERFSEFCRGVKRIWGNGNTFDNAIIRDLYRTYEQDYPVDFWADLDMRTLKYLWNKLTNWRSKNEPKIRIGEHHNALDDARSQVLQIQQMYRELKGTKYGA